MPGKKNRKHSRNKRTCENYRSRQQRERNKALKLARHIRSCPWDECAREALEKLPVSFRKGSDLPPVTASPSAQRQKEGVTLTAQKHQRLQKLAA